MRASQTAIANMPVEPVDDVGPPLLVAVDDRLGVGVVGPEPVAAGDELAARSAAWL